MAHLFVRHKVKDYGTWKAAFDGFAETRRTAGEKSWQIMHPDEDPNHLVLIFEWDNLDNARAFIESPALKTTMDKAGVVEAPEIRFLEEHTRGAL